MNTSLIIAHNIKQSQPVNRLNAIMFGGSVQTRKRRIKMAKEGEALGAFIREQMRFRNQTERAFAQMCNMAQATVNSYLSDNPPTPTIDTLIKISDGTGIDLLTILGLTFPQIGNRLDFPASVMLLARTFVSLPENIRNGLLAMARAMQESSGKDKRPDDL